MAEKEEIFNSALKKIQQRLDSYQTMADSFVREFHDEMTLAYFSDRFGPDHPMSERADLGARLNQKLKQLERRIHEFAVAIEREFPDLAEED